jgi:hypothetical protein
MTTIDWDEFNSGVVDDFRAHQGTITERFSATARVTTGDERDRLYAAQAALMPGFAEYQRKTFRQIPVVVLRRAF